MCTVSQNTSSRLKSPDLCFFPQVEVMLCCPSSLTFFFSFTNFSRGWDCLDCAQEDMDINAVNIIGLV